MNLRTVSAKVVRVLDICTRCNPSPTVPRVAVAPGAREYRNSGIRSTSRIVIRLPVCPVQ